jgi:hypothetical protein
MPDSPIYFFLQSSFFLQKFRRGQVPDFSIYIFFYLDFSQKFRRKYMPNFPISFFFYLEFSTKIQEGVYA